jgi:amino acid adenylation domain-containing protein
MVTVPGHDFFGRVLGEPSAPPPPPTAGGRWSATETLPLTVAQRRWWVLGQQRADRRPANGGVALRFRGQLGLPALQLGIDALVARHEALRTTVGSSNGTPVQQVHPPLPVPLGIADLRPLGERERKAEVARRIDDLLHEPFATDRAPMFRADLLTLGASEHLLLIVMPRLVADRWSQRVLVRDLVQLYEAFTAGRSSPLADLPVPYAEFVSWERHTEDQGDAARADDRVARLPLPTDRPYPATPSYRGAAQPLAMPPALAERVTAMSGREGATTYLVLLAAFEVLLARYSGEDAITVGSDLPNRPLDGSEHLVGPFARLIALRTDLSGNPTFRDVLERVRTAVSAANPRGRMPVQRVASAGPEPPFQAMFSIGYPMHPVALADLTITSEPMDGGTARADLELEVTAGGAGQLRYRTDLFDAATVARMAGHFRVLLEAAVADPETPIGRLPLLTPAERAGVLGEERAPRAPIGDRTLHGMFEGQAEACPGAAALTSDGEAIAYAVLNARSNQIAHALVLAGVRSGDRVAVVLSNGPRQVEALLGILKAGGVFVSLDPTHPTKRLKTVLAEAQSAMLITDRACLERHRELREGQGRPALGTLVVDGEGGDDDAGRRYGADLLAKCPTANLAIPVRPQDPAYVVYTSGSTGKPKGIVQSHRSFCQFIDWQSRQFGIRAPQRFAQWASLAYDASYCEIFGTVCFGATLCMTSETVRYSPPALVEWARRERVTILQLVPSFCRQVVDAIQQEVGTRAADALPDLELLLLAGEALPVDLAATWLRLFPDRVRLYNLYGPTESVLATYHAVESVSPEQRSISIGRAIDGRQILILDRFQQPCPVGVTGELYIRSDYLTLGYDALPSETAKKFIQNPLHDSYTDPVYRTGDLGRWLADGTIEFLGRRDNLVKLHGNRVELGDIESVLRRYEGVKDSAVLVRAAHRHRRKLVAKERDPREQALASNGRERQVLVAYFTADRPLAKAALRRFHEEQLPPHMVPQQFVQLRQWPLNRNRKLDVGALPEPDNERPDMAQPYVAPRSAVERALVEIFEDVLGVEGIGVDDGFFELGGDSLLAMQVLNRARQTVVRGLTFRDLFECQTVAKLAERVGEPAAVRPVADDARAAVPRTTYPLTLAQEGIWFLWRLEPESPYYTGQGSVSLRGPLDLPALNRAWRALLDRHDVLRARFGMERDRAVQMFDARPSRDLPLVDLRDLPVAERRPAMERMMRARADRAIHLERDPILTAELFRLDDDEHEIALTFHEIILDLWALSILIQDLGVLYEGFVNGDEAPLAPLPVNFGDYAVWEREHVRREDLAAQEAYWTQELAGELQVLNLPHDRRRRAAPTFRGASRSVLLDPELTGRLRALSAGENATLFMTLLSAVKVLFRLYSGQDDIIVGAPIASRTQPHAESLIGFFLNMLPLRTRFDGDCTFRDLLRRMKDTVTGAVTNAEYPFSWMLEAVNVRRDRSVPPVFQVMFNMLNLPQLSVRQGGLELDFAELDSGYTKYDLSVYAQEHGDRTFLEFSYQTDLFDAATIQRMVDNFVVLLRGIAHDPERPLSALERLSAAEERTLLHEFNDTARDFGDTGTIHELFERQAERTPTATAYVFGDEAITYAELNARANRLAHHLRALGVARETPVALCTRRSFDMVVGLLGIMKAGGAYVALDPEYPALRLHGILEDVRPPVLVLQSAVDRFDAYPGTKVYLDRDREALDRCAASNPASATTPDDLLNVVYTSSTTGQPKGALITQHAVLNRLCWMWEDYPFRPGDVAVVQKSYALVAATWELFGALLRGIPTLLLSEDEVLEPARLWQVLVRHRVSHLLSSPAFLERLLDEAEAHPGQWGTLRLATTSAEPIAPAQVGRWRAAFPDVPLLNLYGSTECASNVTAYDTRELPADAVRCPVGRPLANIEVYVVDERLRPVPIGVVGEMCVSGACLARGYLGLPQLTAERFVASPFVEGERLYRTGDLARIGADGVIELLGRSDDQVNVRGFRVELGDVETALAQHRHIAKCAVRLYEGDGRRRLLGYVVARDTVSTSAVRRFLQDRLPEYMIPSEFLFLDALPLTPSGKVDRKALPAPSHDRPDLDVAFAAPRTAIEDGLARVWAEVLGVERVGIHDNFFELGGHSLLATQVVHRTRGAFGVDIPLVSLFRSPTIADLAPEVEERLGTRQTAADLPRVVPDAARRYEPFPLTDVQEAYWVGRSGQFELGNVATHFYAEVDADDLDLPRFERAWRLLVERHDMLRCVFTPDGQQQILERVPPYEIAVSDLRGQDEAAVERGLARVRDEMSHEVLPAEQWPLFRIRASRLGERRFRVHFSFDALICDAFSKRLMFREWYRLYHESEAPLPPLEMTFRDYVLAERAFEASETYRGALAYWQGRLDTLPPAPELPLAKDPSAVQHPRFVTRKRQLERETWQRLKGRATQAGLTPSGFMLTCFAEVLKLWSKSPRLTINMTVFNRLAVHPQVNDVVGDFTSLNLLGVDTGDGATFEARARKVQEQLWGDMDHRYVGGVRVLRELARRRPGAPRATMPVVFTSVLAHDVAEDEHPMFWMGDVVHASYQTPQVWLDHAVVEERGALELIWTGLEELFPAGMLEDMLEAYGRLLHRLAADERAWDGRWADVLDELLPAVQLGQRAQVNATGAPVTDDLLHTLFARQAAGRADAPAVITSSRTLSYRELQRRASQVARRLRQLGVRPNTLVAVVMEKGWEQVVAVLGVLGAGAAYVPIDAGLPPERLRHLIAHAEADLALTQSRLDARLAWPDGVRRVVVDGAELDEVDDAPLEPVQRPEDLAYVIYTSGSTGLPKGVMIDHRGAVNTIHDINCRFGVGPDDRVLALSSLSFDLSVWDVFGVLGAGGAVVMPDASGTRDPARWADLVRRHEVTIWNSVPALMELFAEYLCDLTAPAPNALRLVMMSGDWIPITLPDQIRRVAPDARLISLGGATEASIWSILYPIERVDPAWPSIPYGRSMVNQTFHVLSEAMAPCPVWVPGELYIGGIGLAKGYWRDREKTDARFVTHPRTGERLYRTGDLGRYLPDGNIEFLGREDFQVKIQGHRIELGEIEAALLQYPPIRSAVVAAVGEQRGLKRLVAYVVAEGTAVESAELRRFLEDKLPAYMVPTAYVMLPELPLTANGKVDRQALPVPSEAAAQPSRASGDAGSSPVSRIGEVVATILKADHVDPKENLLYLGATSIEMIRIVNLLDRELGFRPRMDAFYRDASVQGLAALYRAQGRGEQVPGAARGAVPAPPPAKGGRILDPDEREAFKRERHGVRRDDAGRPAVPLEASEAVPAAYMTRRSVRHFTSDPIPLADMAGMLGCLRHVELAGEPKYLYGSAGGSYAVQTYVYVKPGRVEGLVGGVYYYHPVRHCLVALAERAELDGGVYDLLINRPIFESAAFAIYLIAQRQAIAPLYGELADHFVALEAGLMSQLLEMTASMHRLGLCQIGGVEFDRIRHLFVLGDGHVLVHSLLGGRPDADAAARNELSKATEREEGEL